MQIGFDIISDLHLSPGDQFDWEGKATSLYCIVAGNVSPDMKTLYDALSNIGNFYQGVFYIPGSLEYKDVEDIDRRTQDIVKICRKLKNVALLHQHVVVVDGVAILACNGWIEHNSTGEEVADKKLRIQQYEDLHYLKHSIEKLQRHLDVTKIVVVTNSVPNPSLYFGEAPEYTESKIPLNITLMSDTMKKVAVWVFGSYEKIVDTAIDNINYINNPCYKKNPYWAKRINVEV